MKKAFLIALLTLGLASVSLANDGGNNKDKGKGTPNCPSKDNQGGNQGGSGGSGGTGGTGGQGGNGGSSNVTVTNDNLNTVLTNVRNANTNRNSNSNSNSNSNDNSAVSNSSATGGNATATGGSATATQKQGQTQGQTQSAVAGNSSSAAGNGNTTTVTESTPRETPSSFSAAYPTAPCRIANSQGGASGFFSFSLSQSREDKGCTARELARSFASIGDVAAARKILCSTKEAIAAKACEVK